MEHLVKEFQNALTELRRVNEDRTRGDAEKAAAIEKIQTRMDGIEAQMKRPAGAGAGQSEDEHRKSEHKAAFLQWMRKGIQGLDVEQKTTLVGDTTAGDILVPEDLWEGVIRDIPKFTVMRELVTVRPTASDRVRKRNLNELSMQWGSWENAEADPSFSDFLPVESFIHVEDLLGITKIGENELADNDIHLEEIVTDTFARAEAAAVDTAVIAGLGHASNQPMGVLNSTDGGITTVTAAGHGAITADDMISLQYGVGSQYRTNGRYVVAGTTEKAMRLLKDDNGVYLWQQSLVAGSPSSFAGYPVVVQDDVPAIPASNAAAKVAIFGDFKAGYVLLERSQVFVQRINELYAEDGLVGFKAHRRIGGDVIRGKSFAKLNVTASS